MILEVPNDTTESVEATLPGPDLAKSASLPEWEIFPNIFCYSRLKMIFSPIKKKFGFSLASVNMYDCEHAATTHAFMEAFSFHIKTSQVQTRKLSGPHLHDMSNGGRSHYQGHVQVSPSQPPFYIQS